MTGTRTKKQASALDAGFDATAERFAVAMLTTPARARKAEDALRDARLSRRAHADPRWVDRCIELLGASLAYPKTGVLSGTHDQAAQLLLELKPAGAAPRLAALLPEPWVPHHRILYVLGTLGDRKVVGTILDWFETKDGAASNLFYTYVYDAVVAIGGTATARELKKRLHAGYALLPPHRPFNRYHRWTYEQSAKDIASGKPRSMGVGFIVSP